MTTGVSELLRSQLPLLRDLGLQADWKVVFGNEKFFSITKSFHNALQRGAFILDDEVKEVYPSYNTRNAQLLEEQYDYIIVHDPQPLDSQDRAFDLSVCPQAQCEKSWRFLLSLLDMILLEI